MHCSKNVTRCVAAYLLHAYGEQEGPSWPRVEAGSNRKQGGHTCGKTGRNKNSDELLKATEEKYQYCYTDRRGCVNLHFIYTQAEWRVGASGGMYSTKEVAI